MYLYMHNLTCIYFIWCHKSFLTGLQSPLFQRAQSPSLHPESRNPGTTSRRLQSPCEKWRACARAGPACKACVPFQCSASEWELWGSSDLGALRKYWATVLSHGYLPIQRNGKTKQRASASLWKLCICRILAKIPTIKAWQQQKQHGH